MNLPLANILHHKLRSVLSAGGIAMGICMLVTLSGLARGSLFEIAERWESVDADVIVFPTGWGDGATARSGVGLSENLAPLIERRHGDLIARAVPVFTWPIKLAGQDHVAAGIESRDWDVVTGGAELSAGRLFDPEGTFRRWIEGRLLGPQASDEPIRIASTGPTAAGLELVIDQRLAEAGGYEVGDVVPAANHDWTIVGIVPAGVMTRVFMPLRTAQYLFGSGDITKCTLLFVRLAPGVDVGPACDTLAEAIGQDVVPLASYRGMLAERFGLLLTYVDIVNAIALTIAFLFTMTTLYTMVLQRTREIAILKSCGASRWAILWQVQAESLLLTAGGAAMGIAGSFAAGWAIQQARPLLTVNITIEWVALAVLAATGGAVLAGLYPAWRAMRVDMAEALAYE